MPHPTWDETSPSGSALANTLDTIIQGLKAEIRERMNDIVVDWTDDPVELKPLSLPGVGLRTGLTLIVGPYSVIAEVPSDANYIGYGTSSYCSVQSGNRKAFMNLPLEKGWQVNQIEVLMDNYTATSMTVDLMDAQFSTSSPVASVISSAMNNSDVPVIRLMLSAPIIPDATKHYYLAFASPLSGAYRVYGARISYEEY